MAKLTTYNIVIGMIVAVGTFGYGFGFGVFITSIGQPGFYADMKLDRKHIPVDIWFEWGQNDLLTIIVATSKYTAKSVIRPASSVLRLLNVNTSF